MDTQIAAKHSGMGIASFLLSLFTLVALIGLFIVLGVAMASGGLRKNVEAIAGLGLIFTWLLTLIALGLGIAGAMAKNTKKVFSVLGIVFSASTIIISVAVIVIGLTVKP